MAAFWRGLLRFLWWFFIALFSLVLAGTVGYGVMWAASFDTIDRRLAALAVVWAAGGFWLAVLAVVVAILAYTQSIRRPKLMLDAKTGDGKTELVVGTVADYSGNFRDIATHKTSILNITLTVTNRVSARNPAVKVSVVDGLQALSGSKGRWTASDDTAGGYQSARWDGGTDYIVHGGFPRDLDGLDLGGSRLKEKTTKTATLRIEWTADGIEKQSKDYTITLQQ